jgi:HSP20 family protein
MFEKQSVYSKSPSESQTEFFMNLADWKNPEEEGQLSVDVLQTVEQVIVVAALAGTRPEDLSLHLHDDLLTIRGQRSFPCTEKAEYFYQECFWGKFSRTIVLPVSVKEESARAEYKNGVLVIRLQKSRSDNTIPILIVDE